MDQYSRNSFEWSEYEIIRDNLNEIIEFLYPHFLKLYDSCLSMHYIERIAQEKQMIGFLLGTNVMIQKSQASYIPQKVNAKIIGLGKYQNLKLLSKTKYSNRRKTSRKRKFSKSDLLISKGDLSSDSNQYTPSLFVFTANIDLLQGSCLNECMQYEAAIQYLTKSINLNNLNPDAYIERAYAYFESGHYEQAMEDYFTAKKLKRPVFGFETNEAVAILIRKDIFTEENIEFSKGMLVGTVQGLATSAIEFIPTTLGSISGIAQGLWAFAKNPQAVSLELAQAAKDCVVFIKDNSASEIFQKVVPELRELCQNWDRISSYERGKLTGIIIGKYGTDIFIWKGITKGIRLYRELRRANTMYTLEVCVSSRENQAKILEEASKRWALRSQVLKNANLKVQWDKQGKHIGGHKNYVESKGKSIWTHKNIEKLVKEYAGTGTKDAGTIPGLPGYCEVVNFDEIIGYVVNKDTFEKTATTWGKIHYAKDGVHIVPTQPRK